MAAVGSEAQLGAAYQPAYHLASQVRTTPPSTPGVSGEVQRWLPPAAAGAPQLPQRTVVSRHEEDPAKGRGKELQRLCHHIQRIGHVSCHNDSIALEGDAAALAPLPRPGQVLGVVCVDVTDRPHAHGALQAEGQEGQVGVAAAAGSSSSGGNSGSTMRAASWLRTQRAATVLPQCPQKTEGEQEQRPVGRPFTPRPCSSPPSQCSPRLLKKWQAARDASEGCSAHSRVAQVAAQEPSLFEPLMGLARRSLGCCS